MRVIFGCALMLLGLSHISGFHVVSQFLSNFAPNFFLNFKQQQQIKDTSLSIKVQNHSFQHLYILIQIYNFSFGLYYADVMRLFLEVGRLFLKESEYFLFIIFSLYSDLSFSYHMNGEEGKSRIYKNGVCGIIPIAVYVNQSTAKNKRDFII